MKRLINILLPFVLILISTPIAQAANGLSITVTRNIEAYYSSSPSLPLGAKLDTARSRSATKKFCSEYKFLGVSGASGSRFEMKTISFTGKISKVKWKKNSDGEDELSFSISCKYQSLFKNLPNSNWYVIEIFEYKDQYAPIQSPRFPNQDLKKSNWKVSLNVNPDNRESWLPAFSFPTPNFKSEGCVNEAEQIWPRISLNDSLYYPSDSPPAPREIKYYKILARSYEEIPNYPMDESIDYRQEGWDKSPDGSMVFVNSVEGERFAKVSLFYGWNVQYQSIYTVALEFGPNCQILSVKNLGRTRR